MNTRIAVEIKAISRSASNTAPRLGWLVYNPDAELEGFVDAGQMGHQALYQYSPAPPRRYCAHFMSLPLNGGKLSAIS